MTGSRSPVQNDGVLPKLLSVKGLSKTFPGQRALDNVSLEVGTGEVIALAGENGSGKSTLVKILAGYHTADPGATFELDGAIVSPGSAEARARLRFVHQDTSLIDDMSVLENLCLVRGLQQRRIRIDWKGDAAWAKDRLSRFGFNRPVNTPVRDLSPAERALVLIVRALEGWEPHGGILVLDEPTAFLHPADVDLVLEAVRVVAREGAGVILISHRLEDIWAVADRVVVLRDGVVVAARSVASVSREELVAAIAGRALVDTTFVPGHSRGDVAMSVVGLRSRPLEALSFQLHAGEILGVTGIIGSGQEMVCRTLFGAHPREQGRVEVFGEPLTVQSPRDSIRAGLAYVPADRATSGCILGLTVRENLTLPRLKTVTRGRAMISRRRESKDVEPWFERLSITAGSEDWPISLLSGGNQQKVVLAKWLRLRPRVFLLDEPTNGVDIAARVTILDMVRSVVTLGAAAIISSMNAMELAKSCDRVLVLADGRCIAELSGSSLSSTAITQAGFGVIEHAGSHASSRCQSASQ